MKRWLTAGGLLWCMCAHAAPSADLWPRWQASDPASTRVIDHSAWDGFLQKYVQPSADGINRVAYARVSPADRNALAKYVDGLQSAPVSKLNPREQRALWINLYNAQTLKLVLEHYPLASITSINISPGLFARGPWGKTLLKVESAELSLNDIEHRILRPIWHDPRTHYSVNCASLGCPNLAMHAYTAARLDEMLDAGARAYINHPRGARVENGRLVVSSIYKWFKADFGGTDAGVIAHLKQYAAPALAAQLAGINDISDDQYDWSLNEAP